MKLTVQHIDIRSANVVDMLIEERILALQPRLKIHEANVRLEQRQDSNLILGARGRTNLKYVLLGSTAGWLLRELTCSVLTVKSRQEGVLVPVENPDKPQ